MNEGYPIRQRGSHLPDHIRRLDVIANSTVLPLSSSPKHNGTLHLPILPKSKGSEDQLTNIIENLSVWVEQAIKSSTHHVGYAKIHLYATFLRCFVDQVVPHDRMIQIMDDIEAYIAHLSSTLPIKSPQRNERMVVAGVKVAVPPPADSPRQPLRSTIGGSSLLSPRVLRAMIKDTGALAAATSPKNVSNQPKRIIQLSEHEESILELALYYEEMMVQIAQKRTKKTKKMKKSYTEQWHQLPREKKTSLLRKIKRKLSNNTLFPSHYSTLQHPTVIKPPSPTATRSFFMDQPDSALHFSLISLCLHELIRRINVFSSQTAMIIGKQVEDVLNDYEKTFDTVLKQHEQAQQELNIFKQSRMDIEQAMIIKGQEIKQFEAQNIHSLAMWQMEKEEMIQLEKEIEWHGYCKVLMIRSLQRVQDEVNVPIWLHLRNKNDSIDTTVLTENIVASPSLDYQRLPSGASLFQSRLRYHIVYTVHLMALCRTFLHLHEKRELRDVISLVSPSSNEQANSNGLTKSLSQQVKGSNGSDIYPATPTGLPSSLANPLERISYSELFALQEINTALRVIEQLYAVTGANKLPITSRIKPQQTSVGTQFPLASRAFSGVLRTLSYCTIAAVGASSSPFLESKNGEMENSRPLLSAISTRQIRGSKAAASRSNSTQQSTVNSSIPQTSIRLAKAMVKLPKHIKDILILPLLEQEPFPVDAIVTSMSKDELVETIRAIYEGTRKSYFNSATNKSSQTQAPTSSDTIGTVPSVCLGFTDKTWTSERFANVVYSHFIHQADNNIHDGESNFIRFLASIQLFVATTTNGNSSTSTASVAADMIQLFAMLIHLYYHTDAKGTPNAKVPAQTFQIFFYCLNVLNHVTIVKKFIDEHGSSRDIWVLSENHGDMEQQRSGSIINDRRRIKAGKVRSSSNSNFVLLESVKTLLVYLLEFTAPNARTVIDKWIRFMAERALLAKVSLITSVNPGPFCLGPTSSSVPNGELTDAWIIPFDFAVHVIVEAWLSLFRALQARIASAMRAGLVSEKGEMTYEEFIRVMSVGTTTPGENGMTPSYTNQLTNIYTSMVASGQSSVRWQDLVIRVSDELDLMGISSRFDLVDFRSIQYALTHGNYGNTSSLTPTSSSSSATPIWITATPYRTGDSVTLNQMWETQVPLFRETFDLVLRTEPAIEGIRLHQLGYERILKVENQLQSKQKTTTRTKQRRKGITTISTNESKLEKDNSNENLYEREELLSEELEVAWRSLYYLQLDHAHALQVVDHARMIQQHRLG